MLLRKLHVHILCRCLSSAAPVKQVLRIESLMTALSYAQAEKKSKDRGTKISSAGNGKCAACTKKNARRRTRISAPASLASPTPTSYRERPESSLPSSRRRSRLGRLSSFFRLTHLIRTIIN